MFSLALALSPRRLASSSKRCLAHRQAISPLTSASVTEVAEEAATRPYRGVYPAAKGQWRAALTAGGKLHRLGLFASAEDAARAYDTAARELQGARSKLNFPGTAVANVADTDREPESGHLALLRKSLGNGWADRLGALQRPAACALVAQLSPLNALGYTSLTSDAATGKAKQGTLLAYVMDQKAAHPSKVDTHPGAEPAYRLNT
jgi:hypothetical protein